MLALFIIAIVWPLQHWLQRRIPPLLALAVTIMLVGAFAWIAGLPFPVEWGVIAFVLNYIPFVGPFLATVFPTLLAMTQFHSWQAVLGVFLCLNVIQFVIGSYVEPRVSGNVLTISPLLVVFATFLWTYPWGLFGDLHRRADNARHPDVLRPAPVEPLAGRSFRAAAPAKSGQPQMT